ncbi:MAG: general secretion pathway protein GspB [Pseudomonadota bacterium]
MSYILEALRKADQERSAGSVPDLEAVHESSRDGGRPRWWVRVLAGVLLVNGVVLAVLVLRDTNDAPVQVAGKLRQEAPARAMQAPPPAVTQPRPAPVTASMATVVQQQAVVSRPPVVKRAASPPVMPVPEKRVVAKVERPVVSVAPVVKPAPQPAARPVVTDSGLPYWDELSIEFRSGFKVPRMDVHVYDADPQRRFLLINLQKYREGDHLESGAVIEEILPDGIQLSYQGTRFIYRK